MIWRYLPLREVSLELNLVRKNCYRLCEDFTASERDRFLQYVEKDFESNDMQYIKSVNPAEYLEIYFLYFETVTYISLKDVSKLAKVFKQMNLINLHDKFEKLHEKICQLSSYSVDKIPDRRSTSTPNEITVSSDLPINNLETSDFAYNLNSERPGLLLIINNENFYAECWNEYSVSMFTIFIAIFISY